MASEAEAARAWLQAKGFDVRVEERDMSDDFRRRGLGGVDTLHHTHWADLVSAEDPSYVYQRSYGSGMSPDEALIRAKRRYVQEQT
jgi:hypothetical protein